MVTLKALMDKAYLLIPHLHRIILPVAIPVALRRKRHLQSYGLMQMIKATLYFFLREKLVDILKTKLHTHSSGRAAYQLLPNVNGAIDYACFPDILLCSSISAPAIPLQRFVAFVVLRIVFPSSLFAIESMAFDCRKLCSSQRPTYSRSASGRRKVSRPDLANPWRCRRGLFEKVSSLHRPAPYVCLALRCNQQAILPNDSLPGQS